MVMAVADLELWELSRRDATELRPLRGPGTSSRSGPGQYRSQPAPQQLVGRHRREEHGDVGDREAEEPHGGGRRRATDHIDRQPGEQRAHNDGDTEVEVA